MLPKANCQVAKICMNHLNKFYAKEMTLAELEREMAYLTLSDECFSEMVPSPFPSNPSHIGGFSSFSQGEKEIAMKAYYFALSRAENENHSKKLRLLECEKLIPDEDISNQMKLRERLKFF